MSLISICVSTVVLKLMNVATISKYYLIIEDNSLMWKNGYPGTSAPGFKLAKLRRASMVGPPPNVIVVIMQNFSNN